MPEYDFTCKKCGHRFTVNVPWAEKEKVVCPKCGNQDLRERFSLWGWVRGIASETGSCGFG